MTLDWSPRGKYQRLLADIHTVLDSGGERTVRDVYYALESLGADWTYNNVQRALKLGRRSGRIDPGMIVDES